MTPSNEERLATIEAKLVAHAEVDAVDSVEVDRRLLAIESALQKILIFIEASKLSGKWVIGASTLIGGAITGVISWMMSLKS